MVVYLFGAASSPSVANYVLKITADVAEKEYGSMVAETIRRNFYVDDCLKSVDSAETAIALIRDLRSACQRGGFKITKFCCNDRDVLDSVPKEEQSKELQAHVLADDTLPVERALGLLWDVNQDVFTFTVKLKDKPMTRRGILSMTSSIYDPLGFVAPFLLQAKKILQDLCIESDIGWDEEVPLDYQERWRIWRTDLDLLPSVSIARMLIPEDFGPVKASDIHVFADASTAVYGSVAYIRVSSTNGKIHCASSSLWERLAWHH